ncbi:MAG: hypothetical protein FJ265_15945 [Planctomycetes bacterium]|nr:hypothetical protein [Planctomycetota bacterium]
MLARSPASFSPAPILVLALAGSVAAQTAWTDRSPAVRPPTRCGHALSHDAARGRTVLFGGVNASGYNYGDTWEWDGATWTQFVTPASPQAVRRPAMVYDSIRGVCVLNGGYTGWSLPGETWEWDGTAWTRRLPAHSVNARDSHAMAFDPVRGRVVLFAGSVGTTVNDTWEYDGTDWTQMLPPLSPGRRVEHRMAFVPTLGKVVLFGGNCDYPVAWYDDTWTWDGAVWVPLSPATRPPARISHGLAFDVPRSRLVLFGGARGSTVFSDTWEFDGLDWTQRTPVTGAPDRAGIVMDHDPARGVCIVFGGYSATLLTNTTWEYGPVNPAKSTPFGAGCPGANGTPAVTVAALPWLGDTYDARVTGLVDPGLALMVVGWSNTNWALGVLPYGLAQLTSAAALGCDLLVSPDAMVFLPSAAGTAQYLLAIPNDPVFAGAVLHHQVVQLDVLLVQISVSDGRRMLFGAR